MRSCMLIGLFKCSLRLAISRVRELGPLVLRSTNRQPFSPNLRFSVIKIQIDHSRRFKGEERDSKSRRKTKARGSLPTVRAAAGFAECTGPTAMIVVALRAEDCFKKKKTLNSKLRRKEHSICTLLMIEQTLIALAFTRGQPKLTIFWKKDLQSLPTQRARHVSRRSR